MKLTLKIKQGNNGFLVGQLKEFPPVLTQGKTVEEVKENILDALELYLKDMRDEESPDNEYVVEEQVLIY